MVNYKKAMTTEEIRTRIDRSKKLLKGGQITEAEYDKHLEYYSKLQKGGLSESEYNSILQKLPDSDPTIEKKATTKESNYQGANFKSNFNIGVLLLIIGIFLFIVGTFFYISIALYTYIFANFEGLVEILWTVYFVLLVAPIFCFSGIGLMIIEFHNEWKDSLLLKK